MFLSIMRVLFGFVLACLAAGLTKVVFAFGFDPFINGNDEQVGRMLEYTALTATHHVLFAAPFALVVAAFGEWLSIRSWFYYSLAALVISLAGQSAIYTGEVAGQATIGNQFAVTAYAVTGLVGGLVYWLLAGRKAGDDPVDPVSFQRPSGKRTAAQHSAVKGEAN